MTGLVVTAFTQVRFKVYLLYSLEVLLDLSKSSRSVFGCECQELAEKSKVRVMYVFVTKNGGIVLFRRSNIGNVTVWIE